MGVKKKVEEESKQADVKIREETEGSGATGTAEAAAGARRARASPVRAARMPAAAAAVTARAATAGEAPSPRAACTRGQGGESLPLPSSEQAHSSHSFTLGFSASADRQLRPLLWGLAKPVSCVRAARQ